MALMIVTVRGFLEIGHNRHFTLGVENFKIYLNNIQFFTSVGENFHLGGGFYIGWYREPLEAGEAARKFFTALPGLQIIDMDAEDLGLVIQVRVPLWMPLVAAGAVSGIAWRRRLRRNRKGVCIKCGYDLRGITSSTCPECGGQIDENRRLPRDVE